MASKELLQGFYSAMTSEGGGDFSDFFTQDGLGLTNAEWQEFQALINDESQAQFAEAQRVQIECAAAENGFERSRMGNFGYEQFKIHPYINHLMVQKFGKRWTDDDDAVAYLKRYWPAALVKYVPRNAQIVVPKTITKRNVRSRTKLPQIGGPPNA